MVTILSKFRQISLKAKLAILLAVIFAIATLLQVMFFPSSLPFGPVAVEKMHTWESQLGKFSIAYPENWIAHELPQGSHGDKEVLAIITPRNNSLPLVLVAQRKFPSHEISNVASWGELRNQNRGNYKSLRLENISTSNVTGQVREYTMIFDSPLGATKEHCLDLYTLNNELGYQFTFCADEKDWAKMNTAFRDMIQSLVFSP